uniref:Uncharacterized protein n=1 Tax=Vespula pensylvanica TaxID=30213 RepID=A0A834P3Z1_VESPE|nr:hypothetical protein H0235_006940 [Vespula pensylvanica]
MSASRDNAVISTPMARILLSQTLPGNSALWHKAQKVVDRYDHNNSRVLPSYCKSFAVISLLSIKFQKFTTKFPEDLKIELAIFLYLNLMKAPDI